MIVTTHSRTKVLKKLSQFTRAIVAGLAFVALTNNLYAQDEGGKPEGDRPAAGQSEGGRPRASGDRPFQNRPGMLNRRGGGEGPGMRDGMPMGPMGPMMIPPVMAALDTDKDGALSASEIENAAKALLTLDKDGDGMLSNEELRPKMPEGFPGGPRMAGGPGAGGPGAGAMMGEEMMKRMFEQRDTNADGKLEGDEIPPQLKERFAMIDTNGDNAIDVEEMKIAAQRMRERMGRPGGEGRLQQQNRRDGEAVRPKRPASESDGE